MISIVKPTYTRALKHLKQKFRRYIKEYSLHSALANILIRQVLGIYFIIAITMTSIQLGMEYFNEKNKLMLEMNQVTEAFLPS